MRFLKISSNSKWRNCRPDPKIREVQNGVILLCHRGEHGGLGVRTPPGLDEKGFGVFLYVCLSVTLYERSSCGRDIASKAFE